MVVGVDRGNLAILVFAVDDDRGAAFEFGGDLRNTVVHHGIQETVHAVLPQGRDLLVLQFPIVSRVDGEQNIAEFARCLLRSHQYAPGIWRGGDLIGNKAEDIRPAGAQCTRHGVRLVSH